MGPLHIKQGVLKVTPETSTYSSLTAFLEAQMLTLHHICSKSTIIIQVYTATCNSQINLSLLSTRQLCWRSKVLALFRPLLWGRWLNGSGNWIPACNQNWIIYSHAQCSLQLFLPVPAKEHWEQNGSVEQGSGYECPHHCTSNASIAAWNWWHGLR